MSENKQIVEKREFSRESALDDLFSNYSDDTLTVLDIPSRGKFYNGFKGIEIKALTFLDEQNILTSKDNNNDLVSRLLEKTITGVNVDELLTMDKMYLLMKVREVSYGDSYDFNITCPQCNTEVKTSLELSEHLNMNQIPEELEDPRKFKLPKLNVDIEVRFPRNREEIFLSSPEDFYKNVYRFVTSIDGKSDPVFISKALKRMHIRDTKKIMSEINKGEYGVDPKFIFECPECSYLETMAVPLDVSFFSVS